ncbi:MAG: hypothetical protein ACJAUW_001423 [Yoonia sp.]
MVNAVRNKTSKLRPHHCPCGIHNLVVGPY